MRFLTRIGLFVIIILGVNNFNAQTVLISDGGTADGCGGSFYDSGGNQGGNHGYDDGEDYTITICPDAAGQAAGEKIEIMFNSFLIEDGYDFLTIYDGSTVDPGTLLGIETGTSLNGLSVEATIANASGCLTFVFTSDTWPNSGEDGWDATINCVLPCDNPVSGGTIAGGTPLQICAGDNVSFDGSSSTAGAGFTIVDYAWDFGDGSTGSGVSPSHTFADEGDYFIQLDVTDDNGCTNTNRIDLQVWAGTTPTFVGTTPDFSICMDEPACLDGVVNPTTWIGNPNQNFAGTTYVPDGVGECFSNPLTLTEFAPGQTLNNINDLQDIFVNMEHSWMGDLQVSIICPDGTSVVLVGYDSSPSTLLGEPIDDLTSGPGVGYDYWWDPNSNNGTWDDNGGTTLPSGTYESDNALTGLVGCPLNGEWSLELCDDQGADDGYVFEWSINFDPSLYPDVVTYTPVYSADCAGSSWSGAGITSTSGDCNNICIDSSTDGSFDYVYSVNDDFGCTYDTTITVTVLPATDPSCPNCLITNFQVTINACDPATNTYSTTGTVEFIDPPATGNLIVEDCNGVQQVFDVTTITSPVNFSLTGQVADGAACDISTYFDAQPSCSQNLPYTAPADCTPPCLVDYFYAEIGICDASISEYQVTGNIEFSNQPATGNLVIEIDNGGGVIGDTIIPMPYTGAIPMDWSISGLTPDGAAITITTYFTDDVTCTQTLNSNAPADCACTADAGTFNTTLTGDGQADFVLCFGDSFSMTYNNDGTPHNEMTFPSDPTPPVYDPGYGFAIFSCPPTVFQPNSFWLDDPCYEGFAQIDPANPDSYTETNTFGQPNFAGSWTDQTLYYVPVTFYSLQDGTISYYDATGDPCYDLAQPVTVQFLPEVVSTPTEDCAAGTVSVVISGGLPAVEGTNFTGTNLTPATASFQNGTAPDGGTIVVQGLTDGDAYSFDIEDGNGCPMTITGTFTGMPVADAGADDNACALSIGLAAVPTFGVGTWSGVGVTFSSNTDPNATVTTTNPGTYTLTWTEDNGGGCSSSDQVDVTLLNPITSTVTQSCTDAVVQLMGGHPEAFGTNYTISNVLPATATLSSTSITHNGTVVFTGLVDGDNYSFDVIDDNGCTHSITGGPFVGLPVSDAGADDDVCSLSYTLSAVPSLGTGTWTGPAGATFAPDANDPAATVTVTTPGSHTFTWTEDNGSGCTDFDDVIIQFSDVTYTENVVQSTCGNPDGEITLTASNGVAPYQYSIDGGTTFPNTTGLFTGLLAATYDIVVEDNLGCQTTGVVNIVDQGAPVINSVTPVDALCNASCDGSIAINATGATEFSIDNGATFQPLNSFSNLCAGTYNVVVQDAAGCQATSSTDISQPDVVAVSQTFDDLLCYQVCTGSIDITATGGTGTLQYSIDNGATSQLSNSFADLCAGVYDIVVEDANTCTGTSQVTIIEPDELIGAIGSTDEVCLGSCDGSVNIVPSGGTGAYSYQWAGLSPGTNPFEPNLCAGNYAVTVTDENGCTYDDNIDVLAAPAVTMAAPVVTDEICGGDQQGTITVTPTAGVITNYYIEQNGSTISSNGTGVFTGLAVGTYDVFIEDAAGCMATDVAVINGPTPVLIDVSNDTTICVDGTATLIAQATGGVGNYTYAWDEGSTTQILNVSPSAATVYCVVATDANGCPSEQKCIIVNMHQALQVSAFSDQAICEGNSADISAIAQGGIAPYIYTWDQGIGTTQFQTVSPAQTTDYIVTVTDQCESPAVKDTVTITVNQLPVISFRGDSLSGCMPVVTEFEGINVPPGSTCFWNFGDGGISQDCNPIYTFTQPGCWPVSLTVTTAEGCSGSYNESSYVCVYEYPTADFEFGPQPTTVMNPTINFIDNSIDAAYYNWTFDPTGVAGTSTDQNPSYTFPSSNPGTYDACLTVTSINGCTADTCKEVVINEEFIVYVPNAFTPDDDIFNDEFIPVVKGVDPMRYEFLVFNRWGELIFESAHPTIGWDGYYKGVLSQTDVYVWKLSVVDESTNQTHEFIGHVTLLK